MIPTNLVPSAIDGDGQFDRIQKAVATAVREALIRHKREGNPVAVWRDGRVAWIDPRDIPVGP